MKLITKIQLQKLYKNYETNQKIIETSPDTIDFKPVIKLFTVLSHVWSGGRGQGVFCSNAALMYPASDSIFEFI